MKTLILKDNTYSFDQYYSSHMQRDSIDVREPYTRLNKFQLGTKRAAMRLHNDELLTPFLAKWKNDIGEYQTIVVFDNVADIPLLKWLKNHTDNARIIFWLWNIFDGDLSEYRKYAEIYCFDEDFAKKKQIGYAPQFYFSSDLKQVHAVGNSVYYVGYDKNRYEVLHKIACYLDGQSIGYHFELMKNPANSYMESNWIFLQDDVLDYKLVLQGIAETSAILEINRNDQTGLTVRTLEAITYGKKLITNNKEIISYDFYNQNDFYVFDEDHLEGLAEFMNDLYVPVPETVLKTYTYDEWLRHIGITE